jgi:hypothetical protein
LQFGARHTRLLHAPALQSSFDTHDRPGSQRVQPVVPPQSTSDSVWFFTPSLHVCSVHTPDRQMLLLQSPLDTHALPGSQRAQSVLPPQSMSVSP